AAIDEALGQGPPPILTLFQQGGGPLGGEYLSSLLWALEALAWEPQYLGHVSGILARLDRIDPPNSKWANRPRNSLRHIFLLWMPQTYASLDERLVVLDRLRNEQPDVAWRLMLDILPKGHDVGHYSAQPRWRNISSTKLEQPTFGVITKGADELTIRL